MKKNKELQNIVEVIKKDEELRKEVIAMLSREFPKEFLSRVKIDPGRINAALGDVVVSCKEWQE